MVSSRGEQFARARAGDHRRGRLGIEDRRATPKGTISLRIPPGSSSGKKLRIKGHGVSPRNGEAGDLLAEVEIVLPTPLDEKTIEAIQQLDAHVQSTHPQTPRHDLRW